MDKSKRYPDEDMDFDDESSMDELEFLDDDLI